MNIIKLKLDKLEKLSISILLVYSSFRGWNDAMDNCRAGCLENIALLKLAAMILANIALQLIPGLIILGLLILLYRWVFRNK